MTPPLADPVLTNLLVGCVTTATFPGAEPAMVGTIISVSPRVGSGVESLEVYFKETPDDRPGG
jgi:hypothetical protein